jgi:hypothetical protein
MLTKSDALKFHAAEEYNFCFLIILDQVLLNHLLLYINVRSGVYSPVSMKIPKTG